MTENIEEQRVDIEEPQKLAAVEGKKAASAKRGKNVEKNSEAPSEGHSEEQTGKTVENQDPVSLLEEEGEIAADYLEELLDIYDLDGDIDIDVRQGRAYLEITSEGESNLDLISKPDVVEAIQELTRLAVQNKTNSHSRLILDIGGSRERRVAELERLVERTIALVRENETPKHLSPMSSYERKIVHDLVADAGLVSESEGEGAARHIVVKLPD